LAGGKDLSSQLISAEARRLDFAKGIGRAAGGTLDAVAEATLFLVKGDVLTTAAPAPSVLGRITRDTVRRSVSERRRDLRGYALSRALLYIDDDSFFSGTAVGAR
jgi:branched-subunit amino acid aminotransferase/4-amino-4-deoxychorismate lyase